MHRYKQHYCCYLTGQAGPHRVKLILNHLPTSVMTGAVEVIPTVVSVQVLGDGCLLVFAVLNGRFLSLFGFCVHSTTIPARSYVYYCSAARSIDTAPFE